MAYIQFSVQHIQNELQNRVLEFVYTRWDKQTTTQRVTLNNYYIKNKPGFDEPTAQMRARFLNDTLNEGWDKKNPPDPKPVLHCYDVELQRWTSIPTWTVSSLNLMNW